MSNRLRSRRRPADHIGNRPDYLRLRVLGFGACLLKSWKVDQMLSPFWRLYCNLDDGATITTESCELPMLAGHVYLVPAWLTWSGKTQPNVRHMNIHFDLPGMTCSNSQAAFPEPICVCPNGRDDALPIDLGQQFASMWPTWCVRSEPDPYLECWVRGLAYWGLREAFAQVPEAIRYRCLRPAAGNPQLTDVVVYIEGHLHNDLSNDRLAELMACSRAQLTRLFRRYLGASPAQYVTERRLSYAAQLLFDGTDSIDEIAEQCGYPNRHYFSRVFAERIGVPPARYRGLGR